MELSHWMFFNKVSCVKMARDLDISSVHVQLIKSGRRPPSVKLTKKICEYTKGEVSYDELRKGAVDGRSTRHKKESQNAS